MNLEDIARKAGVSRSTVSRVINEEPHVSDRTRQRVLRIIQQEDFQPNPAARALVTRRSNILGVAIPQTMNVFFGDNSYYPMLLQGIAEMSNKLDYGMLLWLAESHEVRDGFAQRVARHRQPDGLILTSVIENDPLLERVLHLNRLFVMVETPPIEDDRINYVTVDNIAAEEEAVAYLIQQGRRRIAHVSGQLTIRDAADRLTGYMNGLIRAGLPVDEKLIFRGRFDRHHGFIGAQQVLPHQPDAIIAGGDTIAIGVIDAVQKAGLRVPDDVAVIGFDDLDVASHSNPPLTTIRHSVQTVGSTAAQLLIDLIEGRLERPQRIVLPTELVVRGSTDPNWHIEGGGSREGKQT
jgi:LacI family transcriptional regulator